MAMALPSISTARGALAEVVDDQRTGWLLSQGAGIRAGDVVVDG